MKAFSLSKWLIAAGLVLVALPFPHGLAHPHIGHLFLLGCLAVIGAVVLVLRPERVPALTMPVFVSLMLLGFAHVVAAVGAERLLTALVVLSNRIGFFLFLMLGIVALTHRSAWLVISRAASIALLLHACGAIVMLMVRGGGEAVSGFSGHPNVLAYQIIVLLPWAAWTWKRDRNRLWRRLAAVSVIAALAMLPLTKSAGALLGLAVGWFVYAWIRLRPSMTRVRRLLLNISPAIVILGVVMLVAFGDVAQMSRVDLAQAGWKLWRQAPVSGHGPGQFAFLYPSERSPENEYYVDTASRDLQDHVHLEPLHTAVETGALGVLGLLVLAATAACRSLRRLKNMMAFDWAGVAWISFAAAAVHGAVTLSPSREGLLVCALAFAAALGVGLPSGGRWRIGRLGFILIAVLLLLLFPLRLQHLRSDALLNRGRDHTQYWAAGDLSLLQESLRRWPENIEARTLLMWGLYTQAASSGLEETSPRGILLHEALAHSDTLAVQAPDFFKLPIHRARILLELDRCRQALDELESSLFFRNSPERERLAGDLERLIMEAEIAPANP